MRYFDKYLKALQWFEDNIDKSRYEVIVDTTHAIVLAKSRSDVDYKKWDFNKCIDTTEADTMFSRCEAWIASYLQYMK